MRCSYCGTQEPPIDKERVGSSVLYVCDDSTCQREFEKDARDAEREMADDARLRAEADEFGRYR